MTAPEYLASVRKRLDALAALLQEAANEKRPTDEILELALRHLHEARQIIDSTIEDEGTE
jgi:hypothetical protein